MYPFSGPKTKTETSPAWSKTHNQRPGILAMSQTSPVVDTKMECIMCTENLTLKNIVNTECNHQFCNECFWKWTKTNNSCPFCRKSMLANTKELKDMQNMRELLDHRKSIISQVETEYERKDALIDDINDLETSRLGFKQKEFYQKKMADEAEKKVNILQQQIKDLETIKRGTYVAMKHFQDKYNKKSFPSQSKKLINRCKYHKIVNEAFPKIAKIGPLNWLKGTMKYWERKKFRRHNKQSEKEMDEKDLGLDSLFKEEEEEEEEKEHQILTPPFISPFTRQAYINEIHDNFDITPEHDEVLDRIIHLFEQRPALHDFNPNLIINQNNINYWREV